MNKLLITLVTLLVSFAASTKISLSFEKFHELSKVHDPSYKELELDLNRFIYQIDSNLPSREFRFSLSQENGFNSDSDQNTDALTGEIEKEFIETGTSLSISHSKTTRPDRQENVSKLTIQQSLFKNFFGKETRLLYKSLSAEQVIGKYEFEEAKEDFLAKNLKRYFFVGKLSEEARLSKLIHAESKKLNQSVLSKKKLKIATTTDLNRSELQEVVSLDDSQAKDNLLKRQTALIAQRVKFDLFEVSKADLIRLEKSLKDLSENEKSNLDDLRVLKIAKLKEDSNRHKYLSAKRYNLPEVNLVVGYNQDDSTRFATTIERNETVVGVNLEIPFGDSKGKANKELAYIDHLKSTNSYRVTRQNVETILIEQKSLLDRRYSKYRNDQVKVKLIKNILKDEEGRFQIGRIDLERLIDVKNSYANFRLNVVNSHYEYIEALIDYLASQDMLKL